MWYFILGILIGVVLQMTYQFVVREYMRMKDEMRLLSFRRESLLKDISNMEEYFEWKRNK